MTFLAYELFVVLFFRRFSLFAATMPETWQLLILKIILLNLFGNRVELLR